MEIRYVVTKWCRLQQWSCSVQASVGLLACLYEMTQIRLLKNNFYVPKCPHGDAWVNARTAFNLGSGRFSNISSGLSDVPKACWGLGFGSLQQRNVYRQILHEIRLQVGFSQTTMSRIRCLFWLCQRINNCSNASCHDLEFVSLFIQNIDRIKSNYLFKTNCNPISGPKLFLANTTKVSKHRTF